MAHHITANTNSNNENETHVLFVHRAIGCSLVQALLGYTPTLTSDNALPAPYSFTKVDCPTKI